MGIPASLVASMALKQGIKLPEKLRKQSMELFGYDFVGLIIKMLVIYVFAWLAEIYLKGRIFFDDPNNQRRIGLAFFGLAGVLVNLLFEYFEKQKKAGESIKSIDNETLRQLFGEGVPIGQFNIKYWDLIKILINLLLIVEALQYFEKSKLNNSQPSPMTYGAFVVIIGIHGMTTLPNLIEKITNMNFNLVKFK